ncbi:helix-turn-helix transcriptional regulator [Dactylosporangium matsuzakiense]|uniref:helix-turn-helix transcriptional regulator n=1 Tax=Dactylosporangium matsuzakiense TaxID=53360 RepID=UPI0034D98565
MTDGGYTYAEAAKKLRISESSLRQKVAEDLIPHRRLVGGRTVRFTDEDLAAVFLPVQPPPPAPLRRRRAGRRPSSDTT